ncbi:helix-turn-helix domain-containing protein [Marmoricola sp. OAE513]|uniref:winged helix-turn-helix transcriptional regulator n=1 Tax=Marmoricola sp. OAE513 TaxID=2817894 RepID=UPI001AEB9B9A
MQRSTLSDQPCSVARTLDIIGDRWTPLVLRDIAIGISRFDAIQGDLGVSRKVLTQRLEALVEHDVVVRVAYQDNPPRYDYRLTEKGSDLAMVLLAMQQFGDKWAYGGAPPIQWRHLSCGQVSTPVACCDHCGEQVRPGDAVPLRGPGFSEADAPTVAAALDRIDTAFG